MDKKSWRERTLAEVCQAPIRWHRRSPRSFKFLFWVCIAWAVIAPFLGAWYQSIFMVWFAFNVIRFGETYTKSVETLAQIQQTGDELDNLIVRMRASRFQAVEESDELWEDFLRSHGHG